MEELRESFYIAYRRLVYTNDFALNLLHNEWNTTLADVSNVDIQSKYEDLKRLHKYHIISSIRGDTYWNNYIHLYSRFMSDTFSDDVYLKANRGVISLPIINLLVF